MAAPSGTVPAAGTGPSATNPEVGVLTYVQEAVSGVATLMQGVPVVGEVCTTLLSFGQLVETAKSNKEELAVLLELCVVVITVLKRRPGGVPEETAVQGFRKLKEHVDKAETVAKMCNGVGIEAGVKKFVLARKIFKEIAAVRKNVLDFSAANNLALTNDLHVKVKKLATFLAMEKKVDVTQKDLEAMKNEVALKTKELEDRDKELLTRDRASSDLEAELSSSKEALAAMEATLEEQRRIAAVASRVKVPPGAPRIRDWYVTREAVVADACDRLGIGSSGDSSEEPRMVGLAGPSGAGKSTAASMVIAREDVRASFHRGVLWLPVGQEAKDHLPELMIRLADMVYETVLSKTCRPPRKAGVGMGPEDGAAYIRNVVDESSRRFLVVADDVWEVEVLEELERAGTWVLYTTRQDSLLPGARPLRLDQVLKEEAEMVLRRAADLDDNAHLPEAAYDLMARCELVVLDLALVGRRGVVRGRNEGRAWQTALGRILEAQKEGGGGKLLSWRAAVLRAGLEELACDHPLHKGLYLALAVIPKGLAFSSEVAAVLLYGHGSSAEVLGAAEGIAATLERLSILTLEGSGQYRVHDDHADFVRERFAANQDIQDRVLPPWREYISGVPVLLTYSSVWLVKIWEVFALLEGNGHIFRPYDAGLDAMAPSNTDRPTALRRARDFHWGREDWLEAETKNAQLLEIELYAVGGNSLDAARTLHNLGACASKTGLTSKVKVPPGAPLIRDWYVKREAVVAKACDRLGVGNRVYPYECPQMVGLAGPSGSGKSTVASMVVAREDVRAFFHKGVLWLPVGKGAKHRLSALMFDLASTVWETVLLNTGRPPPRKANVLINSEDGAAYIREVADYSNRRFLVVADDVWDVEVLEELRRAVKWVLYTTRDVNLFLKTPPLRLDQVLQEEAEMVLRRAAELSDDVALPKAAYDLMTRCDFGVKYLVMVGRLDEIRSRSDEGAWRAALVRILTAQKGGKGGQLLSWRAAVLRTGLGVLASDNPRNDELYLALAVIPTGLAFPSEVAGVLLYGHDCSPEDLEAAGEVLETLERLSILAKEDSGWYHVHEDHVEIVWDCLATNQDTRDKVLPRWRRYISSVLTLNTYSSVWLVKVWHVLAQVEGKGVVGSPYSTALGTLGPSHGELPHALKRAADFHFCREDWLEAYTMYSELRRIEEGAVDGDSLAVANILHNLGMCAYRVGQEEETEGLLQQALAIQQEELGADHPHVANTLHSLGVCIREGGRFHEAEGLLRQALCIRKETPGGDPLGVARTLYSLGVCAYKAGRLEEAEDELLQEALVIREEKLGHDHTEVANTLYHLGVCVHKAGRAEQADEFLRRALGIYEQKLGSDHPDMADTLYSLGVCAFEAGRTEEAEGFYRRALVIREEKLGTDHPCVAETRKAMIEVCEPT